MFGALSSADLGWQVDHLLDQVGHKWPECRDQFNKSSLKSLLTSYLDKVIVISAVNIEIKFFHVLNEIRLMICLKLANSIHEKLLGDHRCWDLYILLHW
jgi:hypothetical protein